MKPARRLFLVALGAVAVAALASARRRPAVGDPTGNGGAGRTHELRRHIEDARRRLRENLERARGE